MRANPYGNRINIDACLKIVLLPRSLDKKEFIKLEILLYFIKALNITLAEYFVLLKYSVFLNMPLMIILVNNDTSRLYNSIQENYILNTKFFNPVKQVTKPEKGCGVTFSFSIK